MAHTLNSMGLGNGSKIFSLVVILTAKDKLQMAISHEISLFVPCSTLLMI